ncbi:MAG: DUF5106 domain-containing protein [Rikenellaceae bacterium]
MTEFKKRLIILSGILLVLSSCKNVNNNEQNALKGELKMIEVPSIITDNYERNLYIVKHFWDGVNFSDTSYLVNQQGLNTHFSAYLEYLTTVPHDMALTSVKALANRAILGHPKMMMALQEMFEKGFYHPNSIFKNEELYIGVLEEYIKSDKLDSAIKEKLTKQLELAMRNRVGTKAIDFSFIYPDGQRGSLYKIPAEYLILIFFDPDCPSCKSTMENMEKSQVIASFGGKVKVLTMYAGVDFENWKSFAPLLNKKWLNGCDKDLVIMNNSLYDLRPTPSLYLLDKSKTVILKDAPFEAIESYLKNNTTI